MEWCPVALVYWLLVKFSLFEPVQYLKVYDTPEECLAVRDPIQEASMPYIFYQCQEVATKDFPFDRLPPLPHGRK